MLSKVESSPRATTAPSAHSAEPDANSLMSAYRELDKLSGLLELRRSPPPPPPPPPRPPSHLRAPTVVILGTMPKVHEIPRRLTAGDMTEHRPQISGPGKFQRSIAVASLSSSTGVRGAADRSSMDQCASPAASTSASGDYLLSFPENKPRFKENVLIDLKGAVEHVGETEATIQGQLTIEDAAAARAARDRARAALPGLMNVFPGFGDLPLMESGATLASSITSLTSLSPPPPEVAAAKY